MTVAGGVSYTYDANGNLTGRGGDTFSWDYASRMTGATVSGTVSSYAYDGSDVRVSKTVGGVGTTYLWDREDGLASLVDNGTSAYLHADGVLGEVTGATRQDLLLDSLGSVRGATNFAGTVTATADYDAFGAVRASTGSAAAFGFTGEQLDTETGFEYLRARYYDPSVGRFPFADTVQPNAPGTQGYNRYAYTANNPTTFVDPSGHEVIAGQGGGANLRKIAAVGLLALGAAITVPLVELTCYLTPVCRRIAQAIGSAAPRPWEWDPPGDWPDSCPFCGGGGDDPRGDDGDDPGNEPGGDHPPIPDFPPGLNPPGGGGNGPKPGEDQCHVLNVSSYSPKLQLQEVMYIARNHTLEGPQSDARSLFPREWVYGEIVYHSGPFESYLKNIISRAKAQGKRWLWDDEHDNCFTEVNNPGTKPVRIIAIPESPYGRVINMFPR
jgi:RHS repeat-associated protein